MTEITNCYIWNSLNEEYLCIFSNTLSEARKKIRDLGNNADNIEPDFTYENVKVDWSQTNQCLKTSSNVD